MKALIAHAGTPASTHGTGTHTMVNPQYLVTAANPPTHADAGSRPAHKSSPSESLREKYKQSRVCVPAGNNGKLLLESLSVKCTCSAGCKSASQQKERVIARGDTMAYYSRNQLPGTTASRPAQ